MSSLKFEFGIKRFSKMCSNKTSLSKINLKKYISRSSKRAWIKKHILLKRICRNNGRNFVLEKRCTRDKNRENYGFRMGIEILSSFTTQPRKKELIVQFFISKMLPLVISCPMKILSEMKASMFFKIFLHLLSCPLLLHHKLTNSLILFHKW